MSEPQSTPTNALDRTPAFHRALIIANPIAGRGRARGLATDLSAALEREGLEVELFETRARGDATRRAAEGARDRDLCLSVGGDGTLSEVLAGLVRADGPACPIGVLPLGTANVLALDLGLPRDVEGLVELVRAGRTQGLDVAHVNGRTSFLVTGVGIDARILRSLDKARRGPITRWSYLRHGLAAMAGYRAPRLTVTVDGQTFPERFGWVLVSNIVHYGGVPFLSDDRLLDDGRFEVYLFPRGSRLALLGYALRGLTRRLPGGDCRRLSARHVRVESDEPVPYEVDGDYGGETPVEIEVSERPFEILVP